MKLFISLLTVVLTITGLAQQMPYNPDANGDDFVGVDDVLGVLGLYDTALMQPDLQCDYVGTDLEQLFGGVMGGSLVIDSLYVEYVFVDSVTTFNPECPDPVVEEVVLQRSYMLNTQFINPFVLELGWSTNYLGYVRNFLMSYSDDTGLFQIVLRDEEVEEVTSYSAYSYPWPTAFALPFDEEWTLTENGIVVEWRAQDFAANCDILRLIPFWHEAE